MKIQTGTMLIQDMDLAVGEIFQIGTGPDAFLMRYDGFDGDKCSHPLVPGQPKWDKLSPVTDDDAKEIPVSK